MKFLILDYLRRKSVVLIAGAVLEFAIGMLSGIHEENNQHPLALIQIQIAIFLGPFLLSLDFQRGITRVVSTLPLTIRRIGRAWWIATVAIPAAVFAALLFAGAGTICLLRPATVIDWNWLALAGAFLFLWMGAAFIIICTMGTGSFESGWRRVLGNLAAALWILMVTGSFLFELIDFYDERIRTACALCVGAILTVAGWIFNERLVAGRIHFRPGTQAASLKRATAKPPGGYGGIPLLTGLMFIRSFGTGIATIMIVGLVFLTQKATGENSEGALKSLFGMGIMPFWFIVLFPLVPVLIQLRFMRSLPISATRLAAVMVLITILPLAALGMVMAGVIAATAGVSTMLQVINNYLIAFPLATLSVALTVWRGIGTVSFIFTLLLIMAGQFTSIFFDSYGKVPFVAVAGAVIAVTLFNFWLTRRSLIRSSKVYRPQPNAFGGMHLQTR